MHKKDKRLFIPVIKNMKVFSNPRQLHAWLRTSAANDKIREWKRRFPYHKGKVNLLEPWPSIDLHLLPKEEIDEIMEKKVSKVFKSYSKL